MSRRSVKIRPAAHRCPARGCGRLAGPGGCPDHRDWIAQQPRVIDLRVPVPATFEERARERAADALFEPEAFE